MIYNKISHFNPCVISETACGHDGSFKKLKKLIEIAYQSGSKTIKFQIYKLSQLKLLLFLLFVSDL